MSKYEVILFDADETLFDFQKSESVALQRTMLEFDIKYDENHHLKTYQEINTAVWREFDSGLIPPHRINAERFTRWAAQLNAGLEGVALADSYQKHLSDASFIYEDSMTLLKSLQQNFRLAIITNGLKDIQERRIRKSRIAHYFEAIVISEEIAVAKPDCRIFEYALNKMQYTDKSKVLIVGDSLTSDIQGGINCGIDTCWLNPRQIENPTTITPTYEINGLMGLRDILIEKEK